MLERQSCSISSGLKHIELQESRKAYHQKCVQEEQCALGMCEQYYRSVTSEINISKAGFLKEHSSESHTVLSYLTFYKRNTRKLLTRLLTPLIPAGSVCSDNKHSALLFISAFNCY